jgi:hypothetical protein
LFGVPVASVHCRQHPNSPVLKSYVPSDSHSLVTPSDLSYELWQEFMIVKKANEGDPIAQHELGIRYISGKGFSADTVKAAYWIRKAADYGLPSACYNLGILQNNGWGTPWNPFEAFRNFEFAARRGMPEAEYALGLFYLDNLVVPRDEKEASCLVSASADSEYLPAMETITVFEQRGIGKRSSGGDAAGKSTANQGSTTSAASRVLLLDFNRDTSHVSDTTLAGEVVRDGSEELQGIGDGDHRAFGPSGADSSIVSLVRRAAEAGSPEGLTMIGRWYQLGTHVRKDLIAASMYYIRAIYFDSPRAPELLWNLIHEREYFDMLKSHIDRNDGNAKVVWASLIALQFDDQLTGQQAQAMLETAARDGVPQAIIELGLWYLQGVIVQQDRARGLSLWKDAAGLGSREARIRIAVTELMSSQDSTKAAEVILLLTDAAHDGSVLAQVALGYCKEQGWALLRNTGEAARLYRKSAQRGSRIGFEALKRMHDTLRPPDVEFHIDE